jgi:hypothetical protein
MSQARTGKGKRATIRFSKSSNALAEELPMRIGDHRIQWAAMRQAEVILDNAVPGTSAVEWRNCIYALAEALFQSIHMQMSVAKYKAIAVERGATLDSLDTPLNNRLWMDTRFEEIRKMSNEADRLAALNQIINWNSPGPGEFYRMSP